MTQGALPPWVREVLRPGEQVIWWTRPSRWGLLPIVLGTVGTLLAILVGALLAWRAGAPVSALVPATFTGFLLVASGVAAVGRRVIGILFGAYAVTDARFYAVTSFLSTNVQSVPLQRVSHVTLRQGALEHLVGVWTARVSAYGEAGTVLEIPVVRDGAGLLAQVADGQRRGMNVNWILSGD